MRSLRGDFDETHKSDMYRRKVRWFQGCIANHPNLHERREQTRKTKRRLDQNRPKRHLQAEKIGARAERKKEGNNYTKKQKAQNIFEYE